VAIHTQQLEMHDWLAEACRRRGYSTVWLQSAAAVRVEGAQAAIFDAADCDSSEADQLRCLAATLGQTPILALLDFPRIEDHDRALAAGAAAVVSKPLLIDDLFWELDRVTQSDRRPAGTQDSQSSDRSGQGG